MIKVGITGGIGSGKSTVAKIFAVLGIPVYYADDVARHLMNEHPLIRQQIIEHFGEESYSDNKLNRSFLAKQVFNNEKKLALLNSIVHPVTIGDGVEWMRKQTTAYAIKEAALIFESGSQRDLDFVIGVFAPVHLRIKRVMLRDGIKREDVQKRMLNQINEEIKMKLCDYVVINDEQQLIVPQVLSLHEKLMQMESPISLTTA